MWGSDFGESSSSGGGGGGRRGGGGFVPGEGKSPAPGAGVSRVRRSQNFFPVTIRQINECPDETLRIVNTEVSVVTIVGLVTSVETSSTKISYVIDDQTGTIEAHTYIGTDDAVQAPVVLTENSYGRVVGSIRTNKVSSNSKYLLMFKAMPVLDMNEITTYCLEVMQVPLKLKQLQERQELKVGFGGGMGDSSSLQNSMMGVSLRESSGAANSSMMSSGSGGQSVSGLTPNQNLVYRCVQSVKGEEGVHVEQVATNLKGKMNPKEVKEAIEFLSGEGHIYSTVDDEHYKCTDW